MVEYWPPAVGSGSCDGLSFCLASVATSQNVLTWLGLGLGLGLGFGFGFGFGFGLVLGLRLG